MNTVPADDAVLLSELHITIRRCFLLAALIPFASISSVCRPNTGNVHRKISGWLTAEMECWLTVPLSKRSVSPGKCHVKLHNVIRSELTLLSKYSDWFSFTNCS